jgi:transposase
MAHPLNTKEEDIDYAQKLLAQARNKQEVRMAQSVLLPHCQKMSFEQTANMLGVSKRTVSRLRERLELKRKGKYEGDGRGGRQRENMPLEQEKSFLDQWKQRAASGQIVVVCEMRQQLAEQFGRAVCESYIYRMLARHNWRKLAPDTRHPKADVQKQEAWEKNSRKIWMPCANPSKPKPAP